MVELIFGLIDELCEFEGGGKLFEWVIGWICFNDVLFVYYVGIGKLMFDCVLFDVVFGEMIVFVGLLGSGKMMFVNLMLCFFDLMFGEIFVDGVVLFEYWLCDLCD